MALSDYTILTYIESQGAQYIATGLTNSRNITFDLECSWDLTATSNTQCIIGATADSRNAGVKVSGTGTNNLNFWWGRNGGGNATIQTDTFYKMHTTTDGSSTLLYIDNNYIASTDGEVKSRDIWLFGDSYSGYANHQCPWAKLKYCKIYDSGTLVRDYIPAKRKSDNVLGLYDQANDVFYVNSGTGEFIAGPAASQTFNYTGGIQTYTVPLTGTYRLEVWGGKGGGNDGAHGYGGRGGYARGFVYLEQGTTLYIVCGGGNNNTYNGGGAGNRSAYSGNGGGATHIATMTGLLSAIGSSNLDKILIVAGGGGGGGYNSKYGGVGGGLTGGNGTGSYFGGGGTQTQGGKNNYYQSLTHYTAGAFGKGGTAETGIGTDDNDAGGGGGGLYGGAGGSWSSSNTANGGGGGGSGYITGLIAGSTINGVNSENGKATITYINDSEKLFVSASISPSDIEANIEGIGSYISGATVTLKFIDLQGNQRLKSWTKDGVFISDSNPYVFTITENTSLVANVEKYGRCILM